MRSVLKSIITVVLTMLVGLSVVFGYISERLLNAQPPMGTIVAIVILAIGTILILMMFWKDKTT